MNAACGFIKQYGPLLGRILLSLIFVISGYSKIGSFAATAGYMASKGLPMSEALLALTIVIELGGGLMIMFGWHARFAAMMFFLWLIPASFIFHPFWDVDAAQRMGQFNNFFKNIAIMGGMLYVMAHGSGPYSLRNDDTPGR